MEPILDYLHRFTLLSLFALQAAIFLRVILSWIPNQNGRITLFVWQITEPFLKPLRERLPAMGPLDLSPMLAYFLIEIIVYIL